MPARDSPQDRSPQDPTPPGSDPYRIRSPQDPAGTAAGAPAALRTAANVSLFSSAPVHSQFHRLSLRPALRWLRQLHTTADFARLPSPHDCQPPRIGVRQSTDRRPRQTADDKPPQTVRLCARTSFTAAALRLPRTCRLWCKRSTIAHGCIDAQRNRCASQADGRPSRRRCRERGRGQCKQGGAVGLAGIASVGVAAGSLTVGGAGWVCVHRGKLFLEGH